MKILDEKINKIIAQVEARGGLFAALFVLLYGLIFSIPRYAYGDETHYLLETALIADCIRHLNWFGNELVGMHGFLFKIPVAVVFIVTGPNILVPTLFNVLLASASAFLCHSLFMKILKSPRWSLAATLMTVTSYYFVLTVPSFLRDIPGLFVLLLLIHAILDRKKAWIIGLFLLLLLDAKEYLFFIAFPSYILLMGAEFIRSKENWNLKGALCLSNNMLLAFIPSAAFIFLMMATPVIPLNNFVGYIMGFTSKGIWYTLKDFSIATATENFHQKGKKIVELDIDERRYKKKSDGSELSGDYVDETAVKAVQAVLPRLKEGEKILILDTKIKPELAEICKQGQLISYFNSEFPEKEFRVKNSVRDAVQILKNMNISIVLIDPDLATNKYYQASALPKIIRDGLFLANVYSDDEIGFKGYEISDPYKHFVDLACSVSDPESKILVVDENNDLTAFAGKRQIVQYFSDSFPFKDFIEIKNFRDAFKFLADNKFQSVIFNMQFDGRVNFKKSFLPQILSASNYSQTIFEKPPYKILKLSYIINDQIEKIRLDNPSFKGKILTVSCAGLLSSLYSKFLIDYDSKAFPKSDFVKLQKEPFEAYELLSKLGVTYIAIDLQAVKEADYNKSPFPLMLRAPFCEEIFKSKNAALFRLKNRLEAAKSLCTENARLGYISNTQNALPENCGKNVLILDELDKSHLELISDRFNFIPYFGGQFNEKEFRKISSELAAFRFLMNSGISAIIVSDPFKNNKFYCESALPILLANENYSKMIESDSATTLSVFALQNPYQSIIEKHVNSLSLEQKILIVDDPELSASLIKPESAVFFFSGSPEANALKSQTLGIEKAIKQILELKINKVLVNKNLDGRQEYKNSSIPSLLLMSDLVKKTYEDNDISLFSLDLSHWKPSEPMPQKSAGKAQPPSTINNVQEKINAKEEKSPAKGVQAPDLPENEYDDQTEIEKILLTVASSSGGGEYSPGERVTIEASPASEGFVFSHWTVKPDSMKSLIGGLNTPVLTLTVPTQDITLTAEYAKLPKKLEVIGGSGGGEKTPGASVPIKASVPEGMKFVRWELDDDTYEKNIRSPESPSTAFEMPDKELKVRAILAERKKYSLSVNSGIPDGDYLEGSKVKICADSPMPGYSFDLWVASPGGESAIKGKEKVQSFEISMPESNIGLTATYKENQRKKLAVISGTGSGEFPTGSLVNVHADPAPKGMIFEKWSATPPAGAKFVLDLSCPDTIVTMPGYDISIQPTYKAMLFKLAVVDGLGSGLYESGQKVRILADAPDAGMVFSRWIPEENASDFKEVLPDDKSASTEISMPPRDFEIHAEFREKIKFQELKVQGGSGSGKYLPGAEVKIVLSKPKTAFLHDKWQFVPESFSSSAHMSEDGKEIVFAMPPHDLQVISVQSKAPFYIIVARKIARYSEYLLAYYGKICYPRTFSFLSIPLVIVAPSFFMAIFLAWTWFREGNRAFYLTLFFFLYLAIYLLRASHGRYLMHLSPIIFLFFVMLLRMAVQGKRAPLICALIFSAPFIIGSMFFEENYVAIKFIGNSIFILLLLVPAFNLFRMENQKINLPLISSAIFICAFSFFTFSASLASMFQIGQVGRFLKFGENCEMSKIASRFPKDGKVWFNGGVKLFSFYRGGIAIENRYPLHESIPKSKMIELRSPLNYSFNLNIRYFEDAVKKKGIHTVGLLVADPGVKTKFPNQHFLEQFDSVSWLKKKEALKLKNKTLHMYEVIEK